MAESMDIRQARRIQLELADRVTDRGEVPVESVRLVAGVDCSTSMDRSSMIGSVTLLSFPDLEVVHVENAILPVDFPYIPGYLSFREIPVILQAIRDLPLIPDLVVVDGHGRSHPRRLGIASHLGIVTGLVTIGCAKNRLVGKCEEPGPEKGCWNWCTDKGEKIGAVVRTRKNVKPVWISTGHRIECREAVRWILRMTTRYRLPEPIRAAHRAAGEHRRRLRNSE